MCVMLSSLGLSRMMSLIPSLQCGFDEWVTQSFFSVSDLGFFVCVVLMSA